MKRDEDRRVLIFPLYSAVQETVPGAMTRLAARDSPEFGFHDSGGFSRSAPFHPTSVQGWVSGKNNRSERDERLLSQFNNNARATRF